MSVFCRSLGVSLYLVCGEGVWGGVVFCNALVVFVVPHPLSICACRFRISKCCCCCLSSLSCLVGRTSWVPMVSETRYDTNDIFIGCIAGGCSFQDLLRPLLLSPPPMLHQDSVFHIYGNQCLPSQRLVVRKFQLQLYDVA